VHAADPELNTLSVIVGTVGAAFLRENSDLLEALNADELEEQHSNAGMPTGPGDRG
jgi:hypothetical protein